MVRTGTSQITLSFLLSCCSPTQTMMYVQFGRTDYRGQAAVALPFTRNFEPTRTSLGRKIEAVEGIVPVRCSLVEPCAAIGMMQHRITHIFVLDCCKSHSQKQAQLKVGAFKPQPSVMRGPFFVQKVKSSHIFQGRKRSLRRRVLLVAVLGCTARIHEIRNLETF